MKIRAAALLLLGATLNSPSTGFQQPSFTTRSRLPTALFAQEEETQAVVMEPTPAVTPKQKSMTERMMAKAPQEGQ